MAHEINEGRIMYVGERPWHGIGKELMEPATAQEAIMAARLDYEVQFHPVMTDFKTIEGVMATARADNNEILGIVSDRYKIYQNKDCFEFFDAIVGEGRAMYHTAGALGKGERIWLLAKLPNDIIVYKDDVVEKYLCLTNTHDGKGALKMYYTPIRVVCQNTLSMSLSDAHDGISIRHSGDLQSKIQEAKRILGLSLNFYEGFQQQTEQLVKHQMTDRELNKYFNTLIWGRDTEEPEDRKGTDRKIHLLTLFEHGKGNNIPVVRGSAWAAYNAVTEYVDYNTTIRGIGQDPSNRLKNIWFGTGAKVKREAFDEITTLVGVN